MFTPSEEDLRLIEKYQRDELPKYDRPSVTADIVVVRPSFEEAGDGNWRRNPIFGLELLLIQRGIWPYENYWALPGGFCKKEEEVSACARRELKEETGLEADYLIPIGVFSEEKRDPRCWVMSNAFVSVQKRGAGNDVHGGDDAKCAKWFRIEFPKIGNGTFHIPFSDGCGQKFEISGKYVATEFDGGRVVSVEDNPLAFDHAIIIAQSFLRMMSFDPRRLTLFFLPETFVLSEFIDVYQYLTKGSIKECNIANFRRQLTTTNDKFLVECGCKEDEGKGHRSAKLYRRA